MAFSPESDTISDEDLVARVRAGDREAYGVLWQRHSAAALSVARQYQGVADPDDILQEAAKTVFSSILRGGGPFGAFRPYLKQSVRNAAVSISRRKKEAPIGGLDDIAEQSAHMTYDDNDNALERMITVRAFKALPARWQEVLWYTCVEGMPAREAASRLGLSANATAALAKRAREGLRRSWLEAHLSDDRLPAECRTVVQQLPAYERNGLTPTAAAQVERHLSDCLRCSIVAGELDGIADRLPVILLPLAIAGIDVFGRGTELAHAFLASHIVSGSGGAVAGSGAAGGSVVGSGAAGGGLAGSGGAVAGSGATGGGAAVAPSAGAAAAAGTGGAGTSGGSAGGSSEPAAVGAGAGGAGHTAFLTARLLWIGALAVIGLTAAGITAANFFGGGDDPPVAAVTSASPTSHPSPSASAPSSSAGDVPAAVPSASAPEVVPSSAPSATAPDTSAGSSSTLPRAQAPIAGVPTGRQRAASPSPTAPSSTPAPTMATAPLAPSPTPPSTPTPVPSPVSPHPAVVSAPASGQIFTGFKIAGSGKPGATIDLQINGSSSGNVTVADNGSWEITIPAAAVANSADVSVRQQVAGQEPSQAVPVGTYQVRTPEFRDWWAEGKVVVVVVAGEAGQVLETIDGAGNRTEQPMPDGLATIRIPRAMPFTTLQFNYLDPNTGLSGTPLFYRFYV